MRKYILFWAALVLVLVSGGFRVVAAEGAAGSGANVLNAGSPWRCFTFWKTEEVRAKSGELETLVFKFGQSKKVESVRSPAPPADWKESGFEDSSWAQDCGPFAERHQGGLLPSPRSLALLCLRGKFEVKDPSQAGDLTLDLSFRGGAAVYLNGKEVARANLPAGPLAIETPAEDYPPEAYVAPDGKLIRPAFDAKKYPDRLEKRIRKISGVKMPSSLLKPGLNVLAVEIHRAPTSGLFYNSGALTSAEWAMLALEDLKLSTAGGGAPVTGRPKGVQVWNASVLQKLRPVDYAIPGEKLEPIRLAGARNGIFSGQVVVGSSEPIHGLKAVVSELKGPGSIPASAVAVRYPRLDGPYQGGYPVQAGSFFFDGLESDPPADVPVADKKGGGAVQPVWITVHVPKDAKPGVYTATLTVSGPVSAEVPVELSVADWTLPDPGEFVSFLGMSQSPESLATKYNVPLWSEEHWKLIGKSFDLMGQMGNKTVYIPLQRRTELGNEHTMVRWIKESGGSWKYDFSIAEKYLDLAIKHMGKIPVVCLYVWTNETGFEWAGNIAKPGGMRGMLFSSLDPATGKLTEEEGPSWGAPETRDFWKPVLDGMRKRLAARGMEKAMMFGVAGDRRPSKLAVADLDSAAPGTTWYISTHPFTPKEFSGAKVGCLAYVWGIEVTPFPSIGRVYGWKNPDLQTTFPRFGCSVNGGGGFRMWSDLADYRQAMEATVTSPGKMGGLRGIGRIGFDFFHCIATGKDPESTIDRHHVISSNSNYFNRYPAELENSKNLQFVPYCLVSPGRAGPVPTVRMEVMREGFQETETRILLEKAILDKKIGGDLADRVQKLLDERTEAMIWARNGNANAAPSDVGGVAFRGSGWQKRSADLYAAAAEVAGKMGK